MKTKTTLILLILLNLISLNVYAQNFQYTGFDGHSGTVYSVAFSPDGNTIASGSSDNTIRLWNANTGATLKILTGYRYDVNSVAFSPDGNTIASGNSDDIIRLWDVNTGDELMSPLTGHSGGVNSVAFNPDGQTIASGSNDDTIRLWDVNTGDQLQKYTGHSGPVYSVAFSPDGNTIVSGGYDNTIRLWDVNTGINLHTLMGHRRNVYTVAFSPDGQTIASGSGDNTIRLWDVNTGDELMSPLTVHRRNVYTVAFSPDGKTIASGSDDNTIRLWDAKTGELLNIIDRHGDAVRTVAFSPDGNTIASGSRDKTIGIWDVNTNELLQSLAGHSDSISDVSFSPDGNTIRSHGSDRTLRLWDAHTGGHLKILMLLRKNVHSVAFSPDGKTIASGGEDNLIYLRDTNTGEPLHALTGHGGDVYDVAFSPDGETLVSASGDATLRLWDVTTGDHLNTFTGHAGWVGSVVFNPVRKVFASGGEDRTIRLWDVNTGDGLMAPLTGHTDVIRSIAFSPDGKMLASGSDDRTIRLWDAITGEHLRTLTGHNHYVYTVAFSPNGQTLASGSRSSGGRNATIRLWDVNTGGHLKTLTGQSYRVNSVAFSPNGQTLASGGYDRTIRLWDLPPTRVTITPNPVAPPASGEQFTVNIGIVAGSNIFGYEFSLMFDPAVVRFVESTNGDYLPGAYFVPPVVSDNTVKLGATALTALGNGNGTLATVTFEVVDVTESIITLFDLNLINSAEELVHSFADSAYIEPSLMPSSAVVSLTPMTVESPAIGEQLTFNVGIAGVTFYAGIASGENLKSYNLDFYYDHAALKLISYTEEAYFPGPHEVDDIDLPPLPGTHDGTLGTVVFEVLDVQNSTVEVSGYLVARNGLRSVPTFVGARVIIPIFGDVNKDGVVNILDLVVVASSFGQTVADGANPAADVNEDGFINIIDLVRVAGAMNQGAAGAPLAFSQNLKGTLTKAEVQTWLTQAQQANLTDPLSLRGILFLEQLLAALTPKETVLLANYPNPFNPETWIPYQLSESADVTLTIYDTQGRVVRALDLGHQRAGIYQSRARAAHWDGKNTQGESVASGVYFYTLKAGDFSATRKMLIRK